jgi:hypothetical protein
MHKSCSFELVGKITGSTHYFHACVKKILKFLLNIQILSLECAQKRKAVYVLDFTWHNSRYLWGNLRLV